MPALHSPYRQRVALGVVLSSQMDLNDIARTSLCLAVILLCGSCSLQVSPVKMGVAQITERRTCSTIVPKAANPLGQFDKSLENFLFFLKISALISCSSLIGRWFFIFFLYQRVALLLLEMPKKCRFGVWMKRTGKTPTRDFRVSLFFLCTPRKIRDDLADLIKSSSIWLKRQQNHIIFFKIIHNSFKVTWPAHLLYRGGTHNKNLFKKSFDYVNELCKYFKRFYHLIKTIIFKNN